MSARAAYPMIYERVTFGQAAEARLEIDAILGDESAAAEIAANEQHTLEASGAVEFE